MSSYKHAYTPDTQTAPESEHYFSAETSLLSVHARFSGAFNPEKERIRARAGS
jgi:hypothetical protein